MPKLNHNPEYLMYNGAMYRVALEAPRRKVVDKRTMSQPAERATPPRPETVAPPKQDWRKFTEQRSKWREEREKELQKAREEQLKAEQEKKYHKTEPTEKGAPKQKVKVGREIKLTPEQVIPIWRRMHEIAMDKEEKITQHMQKIFEAVGKSLMNSFAAKAKTSTSRDLTSLSKYIQQYPDFKNLFTYKAPAYTGISKYFDLDNSKEANLAMQSFIAKINRYAQQENWLTYQEPSAI